MASDFALRLLVRYYRAKYALFPPRDFILTGIPRSGTSLLSALLCEPPDCFCFNEIFYDVASLPYLLGRMRRNLVNGEPVPVKMEADGSLTTDTMGAEIVVGRKAFPPKDKRLVVGSNVNVPYLDRIDDVLAYRYKIIAVVRDPVYALASWNSPKADAIPEAHVTDDDMNPRWRGLTFDSAAREERQAELWEHYAAILLGLGERALVVKYEDLCDSQDETMGRVHAYLGVTPPEETRALRNLNVDDRFRGLDAIRRAVAERCPSRLALGYD